MKLFFSNPSLYFLQTKLVAPNTQGNSRWTVVDPDSSSLYGAVGKDEYPRLIEILKSASSAEGLALSDIDSLLEKNILLPSLERTKKEKSRLFLDFYHNFVHGYAFYNYESIERFKKDREQMTEYGKIAPPPSVYTQRNTESKRLVLPSPQMGLIDVHDDVQLLSNILSGTFLAVGLIPGGDFGPWLRKANPSGGGRHPTEALIIAHGVEGIPSGIYYFDAPHNQLIYKCEYMGAIEERRLSIVITARVERPMWRYRESRSFRAVFLDAGHCVETLRQLSLSYGWSLTEDLIGEDVFNDLNLQDIPICALKITKGIQQEYAQVSQYTNKAELYFDGVQSDSNIHYNTNPFFWGYFREKELIGVISYPKKSTRALSEPMFRALNYAHISKRGDRPSKPADISQSQDVSKDDVEQLIKLGFLLPRDDVRRFYMEAALWISYGWYQNLLMYLEFRSHKAHSKFMIGEVFFPHDNRPDPVKLWDTLSTHRKTTRVFSSELVQPDRSLQAVECCTKLLHDLERIDFFHLKKIDENLYAVQRWQSREKRFSTFKSVPRAALEDATIGQQPIVNASDVFWFAASIEGLGPVEYVNTLLRLGMLMQKVCISCADMNLGLFITPATNDLAAAAVSELNSAQTINYFAAIGQHASNVS
ncbi:MULTISPECIES: SagB/ThcOx family dehydrogenase [unclassified Pseudomonas]|uniref:SagB/ThcOx family dehydrogenase n=1 Tax=unclassified Pseudomonas TaxID=196821 RepID=UPI001304DA62|nr:MULTISPECIES: SagB/ThcOx family dehydrogenase [unclassified Pseudomonas]